MDQEPGGRPDQSPAKPPKDSTIGVNEAAQRRLSHLQRIRNLILRQKQTVATGDIPSQQEQHSRSGFETQFSNRQSLKTPEGNLTFVDIKPETEAQDNTPILVLPGMSITLKTEKPLLEALYNSGKHTVAVEFPRVGGKVEGKDGIPDEVLRQAELIAKLIAQRPDEGKIDIVGQSMAAMALLAAAKIEPEILAKIRNVVLVSPAGISGHDNFAKIANRYLTQHVPQDIAYLLRGKWNMAVLFGESNKYAIKNPVRTLSEGRAVAQSDDYDALQIFRDNGVKVALMQGQSDRLTPADKLWNRIGEGTESAFEESDTPSGLKWKGPNPDNRPPVNVVTMVSGGHDNRIYADSEIFAGQIIGKLDFLNKPRPTTEQVVETIKKHQGTSQAA